MRDSCLNLTLGDDEQRRAVVGPHLLVLRQNGVRAERQNEAVENEIPNGTRNLDHASIGKELGVEGAQARCRANGRRAQIAQQNTEPNRMMPMAIFQVWLTIHN